MAAFKLLQFTIIPWKPKHIDIHILMISPFSLNIINKVSYENKHFKTGKMLLKGCETD